MALDWDKIGNLKGPTGAVGTWYQRALTTSDTKETLPMGAYAVLAGATAVAFGLPNRIGVLEVLPFGAGRVHRFTTNSQSATFPLERWERASHGDGTWPISGFVRTYPDKKTRTAAVPLNFPRGIDTDSRQLVQVRIPVKFGADVKALKAVFRNYDYNSQTPYPGVLNLAGVAFGKHQINADGSMTGLFAETPITLGTGLVSPTDASSFSTGARVVVDAKAGEEYLLSYAYEAAAPGQVNVYQLGVCFTNLIKSSWNTVGVTTAARQNYSPLSVYLDVEVDSKVPVYAYWGDSLTAGLNASAPGRDSWAFRHAFRNGAIAQVYAQPGGTLNDWQDPLKPAVRMWDHLDKPDRLYAAMGYNDVEAARPFTGMQDLFKVAAENVMAKTSRNLFLSTLLPSGASTANNTVRAAFNNWILTTLPENAQMAADFHAAIVDAATNLTDARWSASAGDTHLTTAGYARMAAIA